MPSDDDLQHLLNRYRPEADASRERIRVERENLERIENLIRAIEAMNPDLAVPESQSDDTPEWTTLRDDLIQEHHPPRRKTKSTDAVVQIVEEAGHPLHRNRIIEKMTESGATEGMRNPRNATNNAIARSVARGDLVTVGQNMFELRSRAREPRPELWERSDSD